MRANYETGITCLYMCIMTQLVNNVYCTNRCARKKDFMRTEGIYTYCRVSDTTATPIMILQSSTVADSGYSCDVGAARPGPPRRFMVVPCRHARFHDQAGGAESVLHLMSYPVLAPDSTSFALSLALLVTFQL